MPEALTFLRAKAGPQTDRTLPIVIPNVGRDQLAQWFAELGATRGAEIGVKEGDYSVTLLEANPALTLYSVDPWLVRYDYRDHRSQAVFDGYEQRARARLSTFGSRSIVIKALSREALGQVPDRSLDFVYVDGAHSFANVAHDLEGWARKVRRGGLIAGHDYVRYQARANIHVYDCVHAFTQAYRIAPWFVLGRKAKVNGEIRDRHRSFVWVNP